MAKYVLLYSGGKMPESDEEYAKVMKAWETWYGSMGEGVVDPGYPLSPMFKKIATDGGVSDGAMGSMPSGYTIVEAGSMDAAVKMGKACPILNDGGTVSVLETIEMG